MYLVQLLLDQRRSVVLSLVEVVVSRTTPGNKIGLSHFLMYQSPHLPTSQYQKLVTNSPPSRGKSEQPAGHWGESKCDLPFETANNLLEHLAQNKKEFDWIYWTGDLPAHDDWNQTRSDQQLLLQLLTKQMEFYLGDVKIYPTLGNHESAPVNRLAIIIMVENWCGNSCKISYYVYIS